MKAATKLVTEWKTKAVVQNYNLPYLSQISDWNHGAWRLAVQSKDWDAAAIFSEFATWLEQAVKDHAA